MPVGIGSLRQAEIDVLGVKLDRGGKVEAVYAADVAYHEKGLGYKDDLEEAGSRTHRRGGRFRGGALPRRLRIACGPAWTPAGT